MPDPSSATDQDIVNCLREVRASFREMPEVKARFAQLDPWDPQFPRYCIIDWWNSRIMDWRTSRIMGRKTAQRGYWKLKDTERIGIRRNRLTPDYCGIRMTYEFHMNDNKKTDWIMHKYFLVDNHVPIGGLRIQDELVFCKVFNKNGDGVSRLLNDTERFLNYWDEEESKNANGDPDDDDLHPYFTSFSDCLLREDVPNDQERPGKRGRSTATHGKSDVWQHFTKIYTRDPNVVFAVCHYCDKVFTTAHSNHGTTHFRRHSDKCSCKHQQPSSS